MRLKTIYTAALFLVAPSIYALMQHTTLNGNQSCHQKFPGVPYCFPIHAESLTDQQALVIKYNESPTYFILLNNWTGFTSADNPSPLNDQMTVYYATVKNHLVTKHNVIYHGNLGANKVGLSCDTHSCHSWLVK